MNTRSTSPSVNGTPAAFEAMTVAKALKVEPQRADAGAQHDDRYAGERVVAGADEDREHDGVEGEALLGHPVARAAGGEGRHQDRDHQDLSSPQRVEQPADAGIDGAGLRHHGQETADDEHEHRHVDGVGHAGVWIVEPGDRRHQDRAQALRVGLDEVEGAGNRGFLAERGVEGPLVLAGRDDPGQRSHDDDQHEEDGESGRKLARHQPNPHCMVVSRAAVSGRSAP